MKKVKCHEVAVKKVQYVSDKCYYMRLVGGKLITVPASQYFGTAQPADEFGVSSVWLSEWLCWKLSLPTVPGLSREFFRIESMLESNSRHMEVTVHHPALMQPVDFNDIEELRR